MTEKERKLHELLIKRDESGQLAKMLEGVVKVLKDSDNPMKFSQAANTIRGLADTLLNLKNEIKKSKPNLEDIEFNDLKEKFEVVLKRAVEKISDLEDKEETSQRATERYKQLKKDLSYGVRTKKHQLMELIGARKQLRILPKALQESSETLANIYNYFTQVLHHHKENEPEFQKNWLYFQDFLILTTSGFFDLATEIDPFLELETISNERPK